MAQLQACGPKRPSLALASEGGVEKRLLRSLKVGQWLSLSVVAGYAIYAMGGDMPLSGTATLCTVGILALSIWVGRRESGFVPSAQLLLVALWFVIGMTAFSDGMSQSKGLYLLSVLPCIAAHLLGEKAGIRWALWAFATILGVVVTDIFVDLPREYPPFDELDWVVRRCVGIILFAVLADIQVRRAKSIQWQQAWQSVALDRASAVAQQASRSKSEFLARVSHEIRTPMHGLLGMTQQLSQAQLSPSDQECLRAIESCAESLQSLLKDSLELSAKQGQGVRVERVRFMLRDIVRDIMMLFSAQAQMSQTSLRFCPPAEDLWAWGDPKRTRQVLSNLVGNALKFGAGKPVEIEIKTVHDSVRGQMVQVAVRDHGIGIRAQDQEKLFSAYKQFDETGVSKIAGTGLGLAISMELAQQMQGTLSVQSAPGQGSCFSLGLVQAVGRRSSLSDPVSDQKGGESRDALAQKTILVVDDNEVNRRVACLFLRSWGAEVQEAKDGKIARDKAVYKKYDLILMDLQMPVMSGLEATQAIRAEGLNRNTPIFALTANAFPEDKARCLAVGMNGHLAKPFKKGELLDLCSSYFETTELGERRLVA